MYSLGSGYENVWSDQWEITSISANPTPIYSIDKILVHTLSDFFDTGTFYLGEGWNTVSSKSDLLLLVNDFTNSHSCIQTESDLDNILNITLYNGVEICDDYEFLPAYYIGEGVNSDGVNVQVYLSHKIDNEIVIQEKHDGIFSFFINSGWIKYVIF